MESQRMNKNEQLTSGARSHMEANVMSAYVQECVSRLRDKSLLDFYDAAYRLCRALRAAPLWKQLPLEDRACIVFVIAGIGNYFTSQGHLEIKYSREFIQTLLMRVLGKEGEAVLDERIS